MASDEERKKLTKTLSSLEGYVVVDTHVPKLRLFFQVHLTEVGSREAIDKAVAPLQFYNLLCANKDHKKRAEAMLQHMLECVGVQNADNLCSDSKDLKACKGKLAYPTLLVEVCKGLGDKDFESLKVSLCTNDIKKESHKLECDPDKVKSREELFLKLHEATLISESDISLLVGKLKSAGRKDLGEKVDAYVPPNATKTVPSKTVASRFVTPTQESTKDSREDSETVVEEEADSKGQNNVHAEDSQRHHNDQLFREFQQDRTYQQTHVATAPIPFLRENELSTMLDKTPLPESGNPSPPPEPMSRGTDPPFNGTEPMSRGTDPPFNGTEPMSRGTDPPFNGTEQSFGQVILDEMTSGGNGKVSAPGPGSPDKLSSPSDLTTTRQTSNSSSESGGNLNSSETDELLQQPVVETARHKPVDHTQSQCHTNRTFTILTCSFLCATALILFLFSLGLVIAFGVLGSNAVTTTFLACFFVTGGDTRTLGMFDDPLLFSWNSLFECLDDSDTSHMSSFYLVNEQDVVRRNRFVNTNFTETINRTQADCGTNLFDNSLYLLSSSTINFEVCLASSETSDQHSTFLLFNSDPSYQQYLDSDCHDNQAILTHNLNIGKLGNFECTTIPTYTAQSNSYHYIVASTPADIHLRYKYNYTQLYLNPNDFPEGPFCELPGTNCVVPKCDRDQSLLIVSVEENEDVNSATTHLCLNREWKHGVIILVALLGIFCIVCLVIFIATCVSLVCVCKNRTKSESLS